MKRKLYFGVKFGKLLVLEDLPAAIKGGKYRSMVKVKCDCGVIKEMTIDSVKVSNGCGCNVGKSNVKHGMSNARIYSIWRGMINRCYNKKHVFYINYGGSGVSVFFKWRKSFEDFYKWALINGYNDKLTLERINSNKNYHPSNCTWATKKEQANNRRKTKRYLYKGKLLTLSEISDKYKISYTMLLQRVRRYNWDVKDAVELGEVKKSRIPSKYLN